MSGPAQVEELGQIKESTLENVPVIPVGSNSPKELHDEVENSKDIDDSDPRNPSPEPPFVSSSVDSNPSVSVGVDTEKVVTAALKAKRKGVLAIDEHIDRDYVTPEVVPKDEALRKSLSKSIKDNFFFGSYDMSEIEALVDALQPREIDQGVVIIKQGDIGDNFYVLTKGKVEIIVNDVAQAEWTVDQVGEENESSRYKTFGELALLYNSPRAATIVAKSACTVWLIDRITFRNVIAHTEYVQHQKLKSSLKKGILENLNDDQLDIIARVATFVKFKQGDKIIQKGDIGEVFYIIESGSVICKNISGDQADNLLFEGDYFGERALLKQEPRAADVFAESDNTTLIALHRIDFENLLGHLRDLLEHNLCMRLLLCMPMFNLLDNDKKYEIFNSLRVASYTNGKIIMKKNHIPAKLYIVKEGRVQLENSDKVFEIGHFFPENELATQYPVKNNYVAIGNVQCFVLEKALFMRLLAPLMTIRPPEPEPVVEEVDINSAHIIKPITDGDVASLPLGNGAYKGPIKSKYAATAGIVRTRLNIPLSDLALRNTLGTGTFGRVKLVVHKKTSKTYALKILQKAQIVALKQEKNIMNEREVLWKLDHPFIIKLFDTYRDHDRLYMLLELVQGGELFSRLQNSSYGNCRIHVDEARFYGACVLDALDCLHANNVVYRDLKPENLLIDSEGYIKLVDFGFAKFVSDRTYTLCGTPEYLAPELVLGRGHDRGVDYWAFGILLYEMVSGYSPFADHQHNDQAVICRKILKGDVVFPSFVKDPDIKDLIRSLLVRDTSRRLGCLRGGAMDVKNHRFFRSIDWDKLYRKEITPAWKPKIRDSLDTSNFDVYNEDDVHMAYHEKTPWDEDF
jgi:CRP-like cAMP-binding protein/tRNA A-37 threonylcarbamoyl transferase component Bud32